MVQYPDPRDVYLMVSCVYFTYLLITTSRAELPHTSLSTSTSCYRNNATRVDSLEYGVYLASDDSNTASKSKKVIGPDGKLVKDAPNKTKSGRFKRTYHCPRLKALVGLATFAHYKALF
jgi:hypothetical protein